MMGSSGRGCEHHREHREDKRLNDAHKKLQPQERDDSNQRNQEHHRNQQHLAREYVSK